MTGTAVRVAALADLHCTKNSHGAFQPLFAQISEAADVLLIAGDLTDYGLPEEARVLAKELAALRIPKAAVLGNHDVESSKADEVRAILTESGLVVLDGDACELAGIGVAGVKGFGGGFGKRALGPWGEATIKQFVREAVDEALKLEAALARLRTEHLIALLHYAPVQDTVEGEPPEIYAFLGSSRLEEPIGPYPVPLVLHGHAHPGRPPAPAASPAHGGGARLQRVDAAPHAHVRRQAGVSCLRAGRQPARDRRAASGALDAHRRLSGAHRSCGPASRAPRDRRARVLRCPWKRRPLVRSTILLRTSTSTRCGSCRRPASHFSSAARSRSRTTRACRATPKTSTYSSSRRTAR